MKKRYTIVYTMSNGQSYSEIFDGESIEFASNHVGNNLLNAVYIMKNPDGVSWLMIAHIANVDIFEGSDV